METSLREELDEIMGTRKWMLCMKLLGMSSSDQLPAVVRRRLCLPQHI